MAEQVNLGYSYKGPLSNLLAGVRKSCEKMSLEIKDSKVVSDGFTLVAAQKTNWLSTNWPVKFVIEVEQIGDTCALFIKGESSLSSITQGSNNHNKAQELLSLIKVYCPAA